MFDPIKNPFRRFGTLAFSFIFIACEPVTGVEIGVVSDDAYEEEWNEMESAAPPESEDLEPVSEENPGDKEVPAGEEVDTEEIEDYEEGEDFEEEVEEEEDFEDDFEEEEEEDLEDDFEEEEETPEVEEPVPGSSTENGIPPPFRMPAPTSERAKPAAERTPTRYMEWKPPTGVLSCAERVAIQEERSTDLW